MSIPASTKLSSFGPTDQSAVVITTLKSLKLSGISNVNLYHSRGLFPSTKNKFVNKRLKKYIKHLWYKNLLETLAIIFN